MLNVFNSHFLINYVANLSLCVIQCHGRDRPNAPYLCLRPGNKEQPDGGRSGVLPCLYLYPMVRATLADRVGVYVGWNRERQVRVGRTAVVGLLNG